MSLIKIDAVGLQPSEGRIALAQDVIFLQVAAFAHVFADLGGDQHLVTLAAALEPFADDGFRLAAHVARHPAGVTVRGVDGIEASVDESVEDVERCFLVDVPAEHISAEHEWDELQIRFAEAAVLHDRTIVFSRNIIGSGPAMTAERATFTANWR